MEDAQSELIVPTGHDVQTHPNTEAEIEKILLRYLSKSKTPVTTFSVHDRRAAQLN